MPEIVPPQIRQNPRYLVNRDADVTVTIDQGDGISESVRAELADISVGGAKFKTDTAFRIKKVVAVRIEATTAPYAVEVDGEVCWATPVSGDAWYVGCAFRPPLPAELLQEFAEAGVLERRRRRRETVSLSATAKWELETAATSVSILDYSPQGGFCLLAPSPGQPGGRVELRIERDGEETRVRGKIQWRCRADDGYLVGCEFLSGRDSIHFAGALGDERPVVQSWTSRCGFLESLRNTRAFAWLVPLTKRKQVRRQLSSTVAIGVLTLLWSIELFHWMASPPSIQRIAGANPATESLRSRGPVAGAHSTTEPTVSPPGALRAVNPPVGLDTRDVKHILREQTAAAVTATSPNRFDSTFNATVGSPQPESDVLSAATQLDRLLPDPPKPAATERGLRDRHHGRRQADESNGPSFSPDKSSSSDEETSPVGAALATLPAYRYVDLVDRDAALWPAPQPAASPLDAPSTTLEASLTPPESPPATFETEPESTEPTPATPTATPTATLESTLATTLAETTLAETTPTATLLASPPIPPAKPDPQRALAEFREGCARYRQQQFDEAIQSLEAAIQADPSEPVFVYVLAMAQFQTQEYEQAEQSVATAVMLEASAPIRAWGQQMESYQGPARGWLEKARRQVRRQFDAAEL